MKLLQAFELIFPGLIPIGRAALRALLWLRGAGDASVTATIAGDGGYFHGSLLPCGSSYRRIFVQKWLNGFKPKSRGKIPAEWNLGDFFDVVSVHLDRDYACHPFPFGGAVNANVGFRIDEHDGSSTVEIENPVVVLRKFLRDFMGHGLSSFLFGESLRLNFFPYRLDPTADAQLNFVERFGERVDVGSVVVQDIAVVDPHDVLHRVMDFSDAGQHLHFLLGRIRHGVASLVVSFLPYEYTSMQIYCQELYWGLA